MWNHAYPMFFSLDLLLIADLFSVGIEMTTENFGWHLFLVTGRPIKTKHGNMGCQVFDWGAQNQKDFF